MNAHATFLLSAQEAAPIEGWLEMLNLAARHFRLPVSEQRARLAGLWRSENGEEECVRAIARANGLSLRVVDPSAMRSLEIPRTLNCGSTTAIASSLSPIRQVPV